MKRALLILDACVLIDFWDADPSLITLVTRHIGEAHIAENVLSEVRQVDRSAAVNAGLTIVEPTMGMMLSAARRRRGISFQDHLCLLLAKERAWTCVSNDGRLRRACKEDGVAVLWGLELLAQLVEADGIPAAAGVELAQLMAESNPFLTAPVVDRSIRRVRGRTGRSR